MFRARHPVTVAQALAGAPHPGIVHLAPERLSAQVALAEAFRARGALVTLDPGAAVNRDPAALERLLGLVDALLPSESELSRLCPGLDPATALLRLARRTGAALAVKLGARGALVLTADRRGVVHVPAVPVTASDPVGAGDAFCGGFAAGFPARRDPVEAAVMRTVSASFAVEGSGALHSLAAPRDTIEARRRAIATTPIPENAR